VQHRLQGLYDEARPGRPRTIDDVRVHFQDHVSPLFSALWAAAASYRELQASTDAFFIEKLRDVVGPYLNPPQNGLVLCMDEKSQRQALEPTQPMRTS
jgi:putative transposase